MDAKSRGRVLGPFCRRQLERLWVHVDVGRSWHALCGVRGLVASRKIQNVALRSPDSAEESLFVRIKHKVCSVPFQEMVLEYFALVVGYYGEDR